MGMMPNSRKRSSSFYESFSDLLFCTLVLFLVLIVALIVQVSAETAKYSQKSDYLDEKITEAEERLKGIKEDEERIRLTNINLGKEGDRLIAWNEKLEGDARNMGEAIEEATGEFEKIVNDSRKAAEDAEEQGEKARQALAAIVGLNGKMENVVFVLDLSGSMVLSGYEERFREIKTDIAHRVTHLQFKKFNIIGFGGDENGNEARIESFSNTGQLVPATPQTRDRAIEEMNRWNAVGGTPTTAALEEALGYEGVDTIFIYSDGQPTIPATRSELEAIANATTDDEAKALWGQVSARLQEVLLQRVRQLTRNRDITINAIAIGAYEDPNLVRFMRTLAEENKGRFIGR